MLGVGGLSAGFGDFDLVAGIDPDAVDEMGVAGGKFDERIGLCRQLTGERVGFPGYLGPDFLVGVAGGDGVGGFSNNSCVGIRARIDGGLIERLLRLNGGCQET